MRNLFLTFLVLWSFVAKAQYHPGVPYVQAGGAVTVTTNIDGGVTLGGNGSGGSGALPDGSTIVTNALGVFSTATNITHASVTTPLLTVSNGAAGTATNIITSSSISITNAGTNVFTVDTNNGAVFGATVTAPNIIGVTNEQLGPNGVISWPAFEMQIEHASNAFTFSYVGGANVYSFGSVPGLADGNVFAGTFNGVGFNGNGSMLTNLEWTNIIRVFDTNVLTRAQMYDGSGNLGGTDFIPFLQTNVYDPPWFNTNLCVSNGPSAIAMGIISNVSETELILNNTNTTLTYDLSFAAFPNIGLLGGLTNHYKMAPNTITDLHLKYVGTNYQSSNTFFAWVTGGSGGSGGGGGITPTLNTNQFFPVYGATNVVNGITYIDAVATMGLDTNGIVDCGVAISNSMMTLHTNADINVTYCFVPGTYLFSDVSGHLGEILFPGSTNFAVSSSIRFMGAYSIGDRFFPLTNGAVTFKFTSTTVSNYFGSAYKSGALSGGKFNSMAITLENLNCVATTNNPNLTGGFVNLSQNAAFNRLLNCNFFCNLESPIANSLQPYTNTIGINIAPSLGGVHNEVYNCEVIGECRGINFGELLNANGCTAYCCTYALFANGGGDLNTIDNFVSADCQNVLGCGATGSPVKVTVNNEFFSAPSWISGGFTINDPNNNLLHVSITYFAGEGAVAPTFLGGQQPGVAVTQVGNPVGQNYQGNTIFPGTAVMKSATTTNLFVQGDSGTSVSAANAIFKLEDDTSSSTVLSTQFLPSLPDGGFASREFGVSSSTGMCMFDAFLSMSSSANNYYEQSIIGGTAQIRLYATGTEFIGNMTNTGTITATGGFASGATAAPTVISVTGSPFTYTAGSVNESVIIAGVSGVSAITWAGTAVPAAILATGGTFDLGPGQTIVVTYAVTTPTMMSKKL